MGILSDLSFETVCLMILMYFLWVMDNKFVFLISPICQREALSGTRVIASLMFLQYHIWPICHPAYQFYLNAMDNLSPIWASDLTTLTVYCIQSVTSNFKIQYMQCNPPNLEEICN